MPAARALAALGTLAVPAAHYERGRAAQLVAVCTDGGDAKQVILVCAGALLHRVVRGADGAILEHDVLRGHGTRRLAAVAQWKDGERIATADEAGCVVLWTGGEPESEPARRLPAVAALAWAPDGSHVLAAGGVPGAAGGAHYVAAVDATGGRRSASALAREDSFAGPTRRCGCVHAVPNAEGGVLAAFGSDDGGVYVYAGTPYAAHASARDAHPGRSVNAVALCARADGAVLLASGATAGGLAVHACRDRALALLWRAESCGPGAVTGVAWLPNGTLAAASTDGRVRVFDDLGSLLKTGDQLCGLDGAPAQILGLQACGTRLVASLLDGSVCTLDGDTLAGRRTHAGHVRPVTALCVSPEGALRATGCGGGRILKYADGVPCNAIVVPEDVGAVLDVRGTADGVALCAGGLVSQDGCVRGRGMATPGGWVVVETSRGLEMFGPTADKPACVLSVSGAHCADVFGDAAYVGADSGVYVAGTRGGEAQRVDAWSGGRPVAIAAAQDAVAVADDQRRIHVLLRQADHWTHVPTRWSYHAAPVAALAWLPGGRLLVSGGRDGDVHVWDVRRPDDGPAASVRGAHPGGVLALSVAAGAGVLVSSGSDCAVRSWRLSDC